MSMAIELRGLRRDFGERAALDGLDLSLASGESLLVVGSNGSGKTTLLRILATLLRPSSGDVEVLGCSLPREAWKLRGRIGYLGHEPLLYRDLSGRENLRFHAKMHGIEGETAERRIEELLAAVGLQRRADERVFELSAGMRQRLAICRCVLHQPELLLLDEPDSNLDSESREMAQALTGVARPDAGSLGQGGSEHRGPGGSVAGSPGGRTRVIVTHDPERFLPEADRVLELRIGELATVS